MAHRTPYTQQNVGVLHTPSTVACVMWLCPQHNNTMTMLTLNTRTRRPGDGSTTSQLMSQFVFVPSVLSVTEIFVRTERTVGHLRYQLEDVQFTIDQPTPTTTHHHDHDHDPTHPGFVEVLKHTTQRSQAPSPDSQADKPERLTDSSPRAIKSFSWIITNTPGDGGKEVCMWCVWVVRVVCCVVCKPVTCIMYGLHKQHEYINTWILNTTNYHKNGCWGIVFLWAKRVCGNVSCPELLCWCHPRILPRVVSTYVFVTFLPTPPSTRYCAPLRWP